MKTIIGKRIAVSSLIAVLVCVMLLSFDSAPGGDSFTIYLNDKLLVQQYVYKKEPTKTISLLQASASDIIKIHYSHCGKMGVARNLVIKDRENKILKAWKFEDSEDGEKGAMRIPAVEVAKLQKAAGKKSLSLIYSSEQLPEGFVLANISSSEAVEASIK